MRSRRHVFGVGSLVFCALAVWAPPVSPRGQALSAASFEGTWVATSPADRIVSATIVRDGGGWLFQAAGICGSETCYWQRLPLALAESKDGVPHGLAIWKRDNGLTEARLRLRNEILVVETCDASEGSDRACDDSRLERRSPVGSTIDPNTLAGLERSIASKYLAEAGEPIGRPAVYEAQPGNPRCNVEPRVTTTAYLRASELRSDVITLRLAQDGTVKSKLRRRVLTPAGQVKVLAVLIKYPETFGQDGEKLWQQSQRRINEQHAAFARSRGYPAPLVVFDTTNLFLDRSDVIDPRIVNDVQSAAEQKGLVADRFHILMTIDLNPRVAAGGRAVSSTVYVGNYGHWTSPLTERWWNAVAATAYHHEIGHVWGWQHDWSIVCGRSRPFDPFITAPVLFGWEDVDGDGIPEINDPTPYGRSEVPARNTSPARQMHESAISLRYSPP